MDKLIRHRTGNSQTRGARARRARKRRTFWIYVTLAVILLVGGIWQRVSTRPPAVQAITLESEGVDLLPLARAVRPLRGEHNMNKS